jgi:peptidyl-prolyl cis-trans isomerase D
MLQTLHDRFSGLIAKFVLGVIVIVFGGFFGIQSYMNPRTETFVAKVNGHEISQESFREHYNQFRSQMQRAYGKQFNSADFDTPQRKRELLDQMINEELILDANEKLGATVPASRIQSVIMQDPNFQVDGHFDKDRYRLILGASQKSPEWYQEQVRRDLAVREIPLELSRANAVTDAQVDAYLRLRDQTRDFRFVKIERPGAEVKVADAEIEAYYKAHGDEFMTPEKVSLEYVEVDAAKMQTEVKADDEALKQRYDEQKARFVTKEQRLASHILVKVGTNADATAQKAALEKAKAIEAQAKAGKDFAALAKADSDDLGSKAQGGDLGWLEKGVTEPAFESALFALKKGDISDPVKTDEGYHIIELRDVRPEKVRSFDEVKGELSKQYLESERERVYSDLSGKLTDAVYQDPTSLTAAAKQLGLTLQKTDLFTRAGGAGIAANPAVVKAAFSNSVLTEGNTSDAIELGPNHIVFVRVDQHEKSVPRPLDDVREQIRQKLTEQAIAKQAREQADVLFTRLQKGETLEDIAAPLKLKVEQEKGIGRKAANLDGALVSEVFALARPQQGKPVAGMASLANDAYALIALDAVTDADPAKLDAKSREAARNQLAQGIGDEAVRGYVQSLRKSAKIEVVEDRLQ